MSVVAQPLTLVAPQPAVAPIFNDSLDALLDVPLTSGRQCLSFILSLINTTPRTSGLRRECGDRWVIDPSPRSFRIEIGWGFVDAFLYTQDYEVILTLRERIDDPTGDTFYGIEYLRIRRLKYRKLKTGDVFMMRYHYNHGSHNNDTQLYNEMIAHENYYPMVRPSPNGNFFEIIDNWV